MANVQLLIETIDEKKSVKFSEINKQASSEWYEAETDAQKKKKINKKQNEGGRSVYELISIIYRRLNHSPFCL